jgi:hypothetical protein
LGKDKLVLFGSKFWVCRTVRTSTIAVLAFSFPPPIHFIHVSLASLLIVVSTQDNVCNSVSLYATVFLVIDFINVMMSMNEIADFREGH